jgi:hypothetical protein
MKKNSRNCTGGSCNSIVNQAFAESVQARMRSFSSNVHCPIIIFPGLAKMLFKHCTVAEQSLHTVSFKAVKGAELLTIIAL